MKKKFAIAMAGCMLASACFGLAGCNGGLSDVEINWDVDLNNKIDINALYPATGITGFSEGRNDTADIIEDTTGYRVNYTELTASGADNEINSILTTREEYHIMKLDIAQFSPYLEQDAFLDLTELLTRTESGRRLYEIIDLMPNGWDSVKYTNDEGETGIYAIPDFGYCVMEDSALIWNTEHLKTIGYVNDDGSARVPSTIAELTDALTKLQEHFGANDTNYHAFGLGGSNDVRITPIMSAFEVPLEFYVDDNGQIQLYIYSENVNNYVNYLHSFKESGILSDSWQNSSANDICSKFATGMSSCIYLTYWWVTPLVNAIVAQGQLAEEAGVENTFDNAHDELIAWATRVRGDGTSGSIEQEKARLHGGNNGVSYYTVIPWYMAENAVYIIDFLAKKLENFAAYYGGTEGVHWNRVEAPEGAPEYDPDDPFCMLPYEDYNEKIVYLRPYSYQLEGETISGGGFWVQLTDRYIEHIVDNSQYCNGTNWIEADVFFHLRETGFGAWQVTVPMDETIIENPMTMSPPLKNWSVVNILSRTRALRGVATAIDTTGDPVDALNITRQALRETSVKQNGVTFYYWSDDIVNEMTEWYTNVKLPILMGE